MSIKHAIYDVAEFKALPSDGEEKGRFEAIVSVFGNVDFQGDRVVEGAFKESLADWRSKGAPIPIIWSHDWGNPNAHIGSADPGDVVEVKGRGLKVAGSIDLDNPFAAQVYRLLKERRVREFSFGYEVVKERKAEDGANELVKLRIIEAGPTLRGANPNTELLAVKSQLEEAAAQEPAEDAPADEGKEIRSEVVGVPWLSKNEAYAYIDEVVGALLGPDLHLKAGRSISSKNESKIRSAVEALTEVLASLGDAEEKTRPGEADEAKAQPADEPKVTVDPVILSKNTRIMRLKESI